MSWVITGSEKTPVDPQFGSVSLLLHGNGTNGSTTITDSSRFANTVTAVGNAQISTAQSKFGGTSIAFDGTGDYLSATSSSFNYGSNDFTWEGWFYVNNATANSIKIFACNYNVYAAQGIYWGKHPSASGNVAVYVANQSPSTQLMAESSPPPSATWTHYALVRNGNTLKMYRNGTETATASLTVSATTNTLINIGGNPEANGVYSLDGFIDEFRVTNSARYTANFTPPTAPFPDI
jgi:hypothetical protein